MARIRYLGKINTFWLSKFALSFFGQSVLQTSETVPLYTTFKTDELFEMIKIGELSTFRWQMTRVEYCIF